MFIYPIVIAYMAVMARASGGGVFATKVWSRLPEILFAAGFAAAAFFITDSIWFSAVSLIWSYFAMETGHGNAYHMGFLEKDFPDRHQTLDYIVRPITSRLGFAPRSAEYCWVFMGLKGLLIAAPLGWWALALAVLWPLSYYISFRFTRSSEIAEWLSGGCAGITILYAIA